MTKYPIARCPITTDRLTLRPTRQSDTDRVLQIRSNWHVARMLRMASFPPDREELRTWFSTHEQEWADGRAYRFAVEAQGTLIGEVDIDEISDGEGSLGYWVEQAKWGQGYAFEAASAVVTFGIDVIGLTRLRAGHAADNRASGRVLTKLGFRQIDTVRVASRSRGETIEQHRYLLHRPSSRV